MDAISALDQLSRVLSGGTVDGEPPDRALDLLEALLRADWLPPGEEVTELFASLQEQLGGAAAEPDEKLALEEMVDRPVASGAEELALLRTRRLFALQQMHLAHARAREALADSQRLVARAQANTAKIVGTMVARNQPAQGLAQDDAGASVARSEPDLKTQVENLRIALENRPKTEHLVGMIMVSFSCDAEAAWELLRRFSQHTNRPVRHIAESIAEQVANQRLSPENLAATIRMAKPQRKARHASPNPQVTARRQETADREARTAQLQEATEQRMHSAAARLPDPQLVHERANRLSEKAAQHAQRAAQLRRGHGDPGAPPPDQPEPSF